MSEQEQELNPRAVSKWNWQGYSNVIHRHAMEGNVEDGPIPFGSFREIHFLGGALAGEAGELANFAKKIGRDGRSPELVTKLKKEIADCRIYLHHICEALGEDIDEVCADKIRELHERWPHVKQAPEYDNTRPRFTA
jgi:NTP pyrophosphatase (non-canonical NTP hydrolase)